MMNFRKLSMVLLAGAAMSVGYAAPASAQATRTWVSGVGDDANPCSRTAPCKTFAGAISKTATNGEINCLDPGGFGGVTITKGLSIVCGYTEGGILSAGAGVNGIIVNAPATSHVYLSGLDLHGAGNAQNGIRMIAGASLTVEDTVVRAYNATTGRGFSLQPSGSSVIALNRVTVSNNGSAGAGGGILIQPTGASGNARVFLNQVNLISNTNDAIRIDSTSNTSSAGIVVTIEDSTITNGVNGVVVVTPGASNSAIVNVFNSTIYNNTGTALSVNGANSTIRLAASTVTTNGAATSNTSGFIFSFNDNITVGNSVAPTFTPPIQTRN